MDNEFLLRAPGAIRYRSAATPLPVGVTLIAGYSLVIRWLQIRISNWFFGELCLGSWWRLLRTGQQKSLTAIVNEILIFLRCIYYSHRGLGKGITPRQGLDQDWAGHITLQATQACRVRIYSPVWLI